MVLEILCISIRNNKDIHGIVVDNEEIKLGLFADDLTGFLKDDFSVTNFLKLIEDYGSCSDLTIIGRIQIVKTFIIPIFLYRASLIPMGKDFVKQAIKLSLILFGRERIKLSVLLLSVKSKMED